MISDLFENIKVYGRYVRTNKLDGLEYWERIKTFLKKPEQNIGLHFINSILGLNWNINVKFIFDDMENTTNTYNDINKIYDYVHGDNDYITNGLCIYGEENDEINKNISKTVWEKNHFFLQLIRIPKNNKLNLIRLLQVAYNLGQLSVCLDNTNFSPKALEYFKINKLNNIDSYIHLSSTQNEQIHSNIEIQDLINNTNTYVIEQMNLIQTGGGNIEPFYSNDIEKLTISNTDYRRVLYTGNNQQFVLMAIKPLDLIPMEIHKNHDQFIRIEQGQGIAIVSDKKYILTKDSVIIIPANTYHEIVNTSKTEYLKLYTIYSPPEHPDKLIQKSNPKSNTQLFNMNEEQIKNKYHKYKNKYIDYKKKLGI